MISMPWLKKPEAEASYEVLESSWLVVLNSWKTSDAGRECCWTAPIRCFRMC